MPGSPNENRDYTPQWKATKPDELQFLFFEDQELRAIPPRGTIGDTNKRPCNSSSDKECAAKRSKSNPSK